MDQDLRSVQEARDLIREAKGAQLEYATYTQERVDVVVAAMAEAGAREAQRLAKLACEETRFGRVESKTEKNLFATRILHERMQGMRTVGIIRRLEGGAIWEIATPMGVVAALIPSTNPTSTAMYKAIIAAKARCGIVMSPHPRAKACTAAALGTVAEAAYNAGAPRGLFGCMSEVTLAGTNELLENAGTDVILATGGSEMVRAAYSKGKPAYGVGSGNVPVYVDRSADVQKAARDIVYGASFDWGTLCSTERSIIADRPIASRLISALKAQKAYFLNADEKEKLRGIVITRGRLNVDQVGQSPVKIASMAGFTVPQDTRALVAQVEKVGKEEPLSIETLSPILSFYEEDGWQSGCQRCIDVLEFGGIGHTLCLHCTNDRVIEEFAVTKPSMRIVVNTVAALGSVGYTNRLFPAMTLGPGTIGGSITSDNISPMHLLNIKRLAFETNPIHPSAEAKKMQEADAAPSAKKPAELGSASESVTAGAKRPTDSSGRRQKRQPAEKSWIAEIEERLRARAGNVGTPSRAGNVGTPSRTGNAGTPSRTGNAGTPPHAAEVRARKGKSSAATPSDPPASNTTATESLPLSDERIEAIIARFKK